MRVLACDPRALQCRAAPADARGSSFPYLLRAYVGEDGGERSDPRAAAHRHIVGDGGSHPDLATALEVNRADMQVLPRPFGRLDVGSSLNGDIVLDGEQIHGPG